MLIQKILNTQLNVREERINNKGWEDAPITIIRDMKGYI
jgi:hypothetical protein